MAIALTFSPRLATSVETKTLNSALVKLIKIDSRVNWSMSPCRWPQGILASFNISYSSSVVFLCLTNISTRPDCRNCCRCSSSQVSFLEGWSRTTTSCLMLGLQWTLDPTWILTGLLSTSWMNCSSRWRKVAEKSRVWWSGRICDRIERTWYSKPMLNIRSASSITSVPTSFRLQALPCSRSISRAGVATTMSLPQRRSLYWLDLGTPP